MLPTSQSYINDIVIQYDRVRFWREYQQSNAKPIATFSDPKADSELQRTNCTQKVTKSDRDEASESVNGLGGVFQYTTTIGLDHKALTILPPESVHLRD